MGDLQVRVNQQLGVIEFNFEELKDNLSSMMELYENTVVTEETTKVVKKEVASLKKIKSALSDRRIEIKKEYSKPLNEFENKVKELSALIDKPIELMESQVKVFEEKKREKKREDIKSVYAGLIGELEEYLPLSRIYDSKWENVSVSMKSVQEEIEQAVSSTEMAINTIKGMNSEVVNKALTQYKLDLSLANAISYINKHEQIKAEILAKEEQRRKEEEERKRLEEIERVKAEERKKVAEEEKAERERLVEIERIREEERLATEEKLLGIKEPNQTKDEDKKIDTEMVTYKIIGTKEDFEMVEMYLNSIGVEFIKGDF